MEQLRARCPACQKLYQVETSAIHSSTPHFECRACQAVFAFEFPPTNADLADAFLVREAPGKGATEEKPEGLVLQAQPSLVQLWNNIFEDYDDPERHDDFIRRCQELEALSYAKIKYQDLKSALGPDPLCEKYLQQVEALMTVKAEMQSRTANSSSSVDVKEFWNWFQLSYLKKFLYWLPLGACLTMVILGATTPGLRNLIGVGVATGFLGYGLLLLIFGRIHWSDFIK